MAASQLSIYNLALGHLEERQLANLNENREPRRLLDANYSDAVAYVLEVGYWKHAMRTVRATPDTNATPNFGAKYSYAKPSDWVRTYQISADERFTVLDTRFDDANGYWLTDLPYCFIRYISYDINFGMNMSRWGASLVEYLALYLARKIAPRIKQASDKVDDLEKLLKKYKTQALAVDAMNGPPGRIPHGSWVTSRAPRGSILEDY